VIRGGPGGFQNVSSATRHHPGPRKLRAVLPWVTRCIYIGGPYVAEWTDVGARLLGSPRGVRIHLGSTISASEHTGRERAQHIGCNMLLPRTPHTRDKLNLHACLGMPPRVKGMDICGARSTRSSCHESAAGLLSCALHGAPACRCCRGVTPTPWSPLCSASPSCQILPPRRRHYDDLIYDPMAPLFSRPARLRRVTLDTHHDGDPVCNQGPYIKHQRSPPQTQFNHPPAHLPHQAEKHADPETARPPRSLRRRRLCPAVSPAPRPPHMRIVLIFYRRVPTGRPFSPA
jgi:hypothetical protein